MRKYIAGIILGLSLVFSGCGDQLLVKRPEAKLVTPEQRVESLVKQAYATHASITMTFAQNYKDKIITRDEKNAYAARTRQALEHIDYADDSLRLGDLVDAENRIRLAKTIFTELQIELAKQAAREKK